MDLSLRDAMISDLDACLGLLSSPWMCDPADHRALHAMWREIINEKSGVSCVALQNGSAIYFIFGVFVLNERADGYHRLASPLIARQILTEWRNGGRAFLQASEIAHANAGEGLNLVVAYFGVDRAIPDEFSYAVDYEAGRRIVAGWNLRTFTCETFTRGRFDGPSWGEKLGYRVGCYAPAVLRCAGIPDEEAPCVWAAKREDARGSNSIALAELFALFTPPRCGFTPREQQTLLLALEGHTDQGIATGLGVSNSTAKRLIRGIYEKAEDAIQDLEPPGTLASHGTRGPEIRRRLLNYVRQHPEELRPYG